jgi:hypothetical protein
VVPRKGELQVSPEGLEELLVPPGKGEFRVGSDPCAVERIGFDAVR